MKNRFSFFCFLLALQLSAQDSYHTALNAKLQNEYNLPSLSQWVLPNTETATFGSASYYGATVSSLTPSGQLFALARRMDVTQGVNPWDAGHLYQNPVAVSNTDKCLLIIWLRSPTANAKVNIFAENNTTYYKEAFAAVNLSVDWKMYAIPFTASENYPANTLNSGLHLAYLNQSVEVGGMAILNYKNTVSQDQLPILLNNDSYPGMEANAPWRAEAAASIEQLRKANLTVNVQDQNGNPLPNAHVYLEMQQHEFKFGTAVISSFFGPGNNQNDTYEQKMLNLDGLGHGFNEVVFENDLKWPAWEQHWYSSWPEIADAVQWLHSHNMSIRGHNLIWPGWDYSPPDLEPNKSNPGYLINRIREHLNSILPYPGVGTEMEDWDVLNEITYNNDYANALAGTPGFVSGRELYAQVYKQADSLAPESKLYLNDYVAIEQGDSPGNGISLWKSRLDELLAAGAPVEGIGFQGHFGASPTGIPRVKEIYDDFWSTYGLESKVTEYDISNLLPPQTQAQYMRDILTISFAHPSLKGFLMWGFWDGAHWLNNAPIYTEDWSLKPSGEAFIDQVFHEWWTNTSGQTSAAGAVTLRGFKGKYRLRVACSSSITEQDVVLDGDKTLTVHLNCLSRTRETNTNPEFLVQPNLVDHQLNISWESGQKLKGLQVCNALGQVVAHIQYPTGSPFRLDVSTWTPGIYWVLADFEGISVSRKVAIHP